jgi:hypothetical protein
MRVGLWAFAAVAVASFIGLAGQSASGATGTFAQAAAVPAGLTRPGFIYLLTDGTVIAHDQSGQYQNWWRLTPDNTGSYANGAWTQLASIPASFNYGPRFYAAAVLPDGRLAIEGGEYNLGSNMQSFVNLGAIYNPKTNQWLNVRQPFGWTQIGDAQAVVLPSGQWMLSDSQNTQMVLFNANNLTWTPTGFNFATCTNDEAGWTLLTDGSVFTTDNNIASGSRCRGTQNGERWVPGSSGRPIGTWYLADNGTGTQQLYDPQQEMGPQVLLPNKTVLAIGANGNVSIYTPPAVTSPASTLPGSWANTTALPLTCGSPNNNSQCAANDAPAALLPNGNVLLFAGPVGTGPGNAEFPIGSHFYEFDSNSNWTQVTEPAALATQIKNDASYFGQLLMLPNGQVLFTDGIGNSSNVWVYTPDPTPAPNPAWVPTITAFPASITRGSTYNISGTLFNGVSQANYYGDDSQNATNYPIIQVTINASGHVYYGRTHDHSSMGVNLAGLTVATKFELLPCPQPAGASCVPETGAATLTVIANGIKTAPVNVTIN